MKQVTGSNIQQTANKVSIQLSLDGHSFSVPALSELPISGGHAEVELLLPHTMLVPEELFDAEHAAQLLAANGIPVATDECTVASDPRDGVIAVIAINADALNLVNEKLGERARFTTPLLHRPKNTVSTVWMSRKANLLYIKVYKEGILHLAEVIPAPTDTDVLYFFEQLDTLFPLADYQLLVANTELKSARKLLGRRFKQILCE